MRKRILSFLVIILTVVFITGCGSKDGGSSILSKSLKANDLSVKDFSLTTKETYIDGHKYYATSIVNNSDYDIVGAKISYKAKSTASDDDLKVYADFMKEHDGYIEEDDPINGVTLNGHRDKLAKKGETLDQIKVYVGYEDTCWSTTPTEEQFNLMEPNKLEIGIIGKNNVLYVAYYDFGKDSWKLDEKSKEMNTIPKTDLANKLVKPESNYMVLKTDIDDEDEIKLYVYGFSKVEFKDYLKEVVNFGFEVKEFDDSYSTYYETAKNADENKITLSYDKNDEIAIVTLDQK